MCQVGRNVGLHGCFHWRWEPCFQKRDMDADPEVLLCPRLCVDLWTHCHFRLFVVFNPMSIVHHASKNGQESNTLFLKKYDWRESLMPSMVCKHRRWTKDWGQSLSCQCGVSQAPWETSFTCEIRTLLSFLWYDTPFSLISCSCHLDKEVCRHLPSLEH